MNRFIRGGRYVVVDIETFGLYHQTDMPFQFGIGVYNIQPDLTLTEEALMSIYIWTPAHQERYMVVVTDSHYGSQVEMDNAKFILDMHDRTGAFDRARATGVDFQEAQETILAFMDENDVNEDPLVGSSVQFDRESMQVWLPSVEERFSYRNLDVSSLQIACEATNPELYAKHGVDLKPKKAHNVRDDIRDTVAELQWYFQNFIYAPGNKNDLILD